MFTPGQTQAKERSSLLDCDALFQMLERSVSFISNSVSDLVTDKSQGRIHPSRGFLIYP